MIFLYNILFQNFKTKILYNHYCDSYNMVLACISLDYINSSEKESLRIRATETVQIFSFLFLRALGRNDHQGKSGNIIFEVVLDFENKRIITLII